MAAISPAPKLQFFTANGVPLAGGKLYSYAAGTSTPLATYTDQSGGAANTNPIILDSRGEASVWLGSSLYKLVLTTATDVEVWTVDNVGGAATLAQLAASGGSALIGFLQAGTNAAARTVQSKLRDVVSVLDFGADPTGGTPSTAAMQAAHDTGKLVYYPDGTYLFSSITISTGGIIGAGRARTTLKTSTTSTENVITVTGKYNSSNDQASNMHTFEDFTLWANPAKTGGAGIYMNPASGESSYTLFHRMCITYIPTCIQFTRGSLWKASDCDFLGYTVAGIYQANAEDSDSGDARVLGCMFNTPFSTGSALLQTTGGGTVFANNKVLGGGRGVDLQMSGTKNTGILIINGNSIENTTNQGVSLARTSGSATWTFVVISSNEIAGMQYAIQTDSNTFLNDLIISNNVIAVSANGQAIGLDKVTNFLIEGNILRGTSGTSTGIALTSGCSNGKVSADNMYVGLTTPVSNSCTTATVDLNQQKGTVTTANTGWAAYGTLYLSPKQTVTFARAFLNTPTVSDVQLTIAGANGEIGTLVSSVNATTLEFYVISAVNNIAAQAAWQVQGIL